MVKMLVRVMNEELPEPVRNILQKMPDGVDLLHSQKIGEVVMDQFIKDDFIEGLNRSIKYPEDAP